MKERAIRGGTTRSETDGAPSRVIVKFRIFWLGKFAAIWTSMNHINHEQACHSMLSEDSMKFAFQVIFLGVALTASSLFFSRAAVDSTLRGFPVWYVDVIPGTSYESSTGPGRDVWFLRGYGPLATDVVAWTAIACASLAIFRFRKKGDDVH